MKNLQINRFISYVLLTLIFAGCAASRVTTPNYIGRWDYEIDTPQGRQSGWIILNQEGKEVTGTINSDMGSTDLRDLKIENNIMTANFNAFDMDMDLSGEFAEDVLNAKIVVQGYELPFTATKARE
jgi:hypothetical protein